MAVRHLDDPRTVAIISAVSPFPVSSGKDVMLAGIVSYWASKVGVENVHYVLVRPTGEEAPRNFPVTLHCLPAASALRRLHSVATRSLPGRSSLQESMLYDPALGLRIGALVADLNADVVLFDTVRLGQYVDHLRPRPGQQRIAYLDDLFSERYAAMLKAVGDHPDVEVDALGQFRAFIPGPLRGLAQARSVQRALLTWERRLIARAERLSVSKFDKVLLINHLETQYLAASTGATNVRSLPPLLPHSATRRPTYDGRPEFVFVGQLSIPHNDDGINWFLEQAMGPLLDLLPHARLRIIGRDPRSRLVANVARFGDRVRLEGYVPDLDGALGQAGVMISPLRFGSGVKIKLVEALARALPSITTTVGAHGVVEDDRCGVLVEDDLARYPALLAELTDPARNQAVSAAAAAHFTARFSRPAVLAVYDRVFAAPAAPSANAAPAAVLPGKMPTVRVGHTIS